MRSAVSIWGYCLPVERKGNVDMMFTSTNTKKVSKYLT